MRAQTQTRVQSDGVDKKVSNTQLSIVYVWSVGYMYSMSDEMCFYEIFAGRW